MFLVTVKQLFWEYKLHWLVISASSGCRAPWQGPSYFQLCFLWPQLHLTWQMLCCAGLLCLHLCPPTRMQAQECSHFCWSSVALVWLVAVPGTQSGAQCMAVEWTERRSWSTSFLPVSLGKLCPARCTSTEIMATVSRELSHSGALGHSTGRFLDTLSQTSRPRWLQPGSQVLSPSQALHLCLHSSQAPPFAGHSGAPACDHSLYSASLPWAAAFWIQPIRRDQGTCHLLHEGFPGPRLKWSFLCVHGYAF